MSFIAVICGLKSEAAAVRGAVGEHKIRIGISGADAGRAYALAKRAAQDGAGAILSVGVSGGLDPALAPGDLVLGADIIADDGARYEADRYLLGAIQSAHSRENGNPAPSRTMDPRARGDEPAMQSGAISGTLFGSDSIIQSTSHKAALFANHGAIAVDMESHGCAKAAAEAGTPFLAIRAIADPAGRALPKAALSAVAPDGSTKVISTLTAALRDPAQFPQLMQLGKDSSAALKTFRGNLAPIFRRLFLALDL